MKLVRAFHRSCTRRLLEKPPPESACTSAQAFLRLWQAQLSPTMRHQRQTDTSRPCRKVCQNLMDRLSSCLFRYPFRHRIFDVSQVKIALDLCYRVKPQFFGNTSMYCVHSSDFLRLSEQRRVKYSRFANFNSAKRFRQCRRIQHRTNRNVNGLENTH